MFDPHVIGSIDLMTGQALTVSGGATPSKTSNILKISKLSKLHVYVGNAGPSTNVTVDIYGKTKETSTIKLHLATFTLGAGTAQTPYSAGRYIEKDAIPSFIYAVATNSDTANAANVSCTIDRWR